MKTEPALKKWILGRPNSFAKNDNRMASEGDVAGARQRFIERRHNNLDFMLRKRYEWMNDYIRPDAEVLEIGVGAGFSEFYLSKRPIMTDAIQNEWVDRIVNALDINMPADSLDVIIASHNIHHFASPYKFFTECRRVLRPDGVVLIQEINTSLMMRVLLRIMRHEGWSYDIDVFDPDVTANDPEDPWSANCAVPELLFEQPDKFRQTFPSLQIIKNEKNEGFVFPLSGGVIAKTKVPELPTAVLKCVYGLDRVLIGVLPNIFALGRSVVLRKV